MFAIIQSRNFYSNFASGSVRVRDLVSDINGGTQTEGV
jgi:hypothetical protein